MRMLPITLVAPDTRGRAALERIDELAKQIAKRWPPGAPRPEWRIVTSDEAAADPSVLSGSAVVALEEGLSPVELYKLVDSIADSLTPAIVLTPGKPRAELDRVGAIAAPDATDPAVLAGMLHALISRQPALEALVAELGAARRFQGGLADQMGKMHEELQLAASVQREFLPLEMPEAPGLEFGVLFRPCSYVSGDIYNVVRLDETHVGFFVADAVGHGVPAALMTVALSRGLPMLETHGQATRVVPPSEAMERLNEALLRGQGPSRRFATAVYGVIDSADRTVTLSGAGHPPPLRIQPDGAATPVETEGCLLGVFPDAKFTQATFEMKPDEALLVFSDGFETAFPQLLAAGETRPKGVRPTTLYLDHFVALAEARRRAGMHAAIEALQRQLDEQSGSLHQLDDLTALVIAGAAEAA